MPGCGIEPIHGVFFTCVSINSGLIADAQSKPMLTHQTNFALRTALALAALLTLSGCLNTGDNRRPIPFETTAGAASDGKVLVIVLPGRWDDVEALSEAGIDRAILEVWPEADVMLSGATLAYYQDGGLATRLRSELISPARDRGYQQIWLVGASMGGLGALLYERQFPADVQGLVLLAPYMGGRGLLREIADAGGIVEWNPGPVPPEVTRSNYQRELWRHLQSWTMPPRRGQNVWIAVGDEDAFVKALPLLEAVVPEQQRLVRPGGHAWAVWVPAAAEIFATIRDRNAG